jgi:hypothetical protein
MAGGVLPEKSIHDTLDAVVLISIGEPFPQRSLSVVAVVLYEFVIEEFP